MAHHLRAGAIDDGYRPLSVDDRPHIGRIAAGDGSDVGVAESGSREDSLGARRGPAAVLVAFADDQREEGSERGLELDGRGTVVLVAHRDLRGVCWRAEPVPVKRPGDPKREMGAHETMGTERALRRPR